MSTTKNEMMNSMPEMNGYRFEEHVLRSSFHVNKRFHLRRFGARKHEVLVVEKHLGDNFFFRLPSVLLRRFHNIVAK